MAPSSCEPSPLVYFCRRMSYVSHVDNYSLANMYAVSPSLDKILLAMPLVVIAHGFLQARYSFMFVPDRGYYYCVAA